VDQKAGNQLLYLPLDKLLSASDSNKTNNPEVNSTVAPTTDGASDKSRSRDASRGRERE